MYRPLSFENDLFTARVYKRNYSRPIVRRDSKPRRPMKVEEVAAHISDQDVKEDLTYTSGSEGVSNHVQGTMRDEIAVPGLEAIHIAAKNGHLGVLKSLINRGGNIEIRGLSTGERPLHVAIQAGHLSIVQYLVEKGADILAPDNQGTQPIHVAARIGSIEILKFLIDTGAAIDSRDSSGRQPLHYTSMYLDKPDVIQFLQGQNADLEARCNGPFYLRPLNFACAYNRIKSIGTLVSLGAGTGGEHSGKEQSALGTALDSQSWSATSQLLGHGVDPNRRDSAGKTALHVLVAGSTSGYFGDYRSSWKDIPILQLLMQHNPDVNAQDLEGNTPLHCLNQRLEFGKAGIHNQVQMAKLLINRKSDIDAVNHDGMTALYTSCMIAGKDALGVFLIESGACLLICNKNFKLALHIDKTASPAVSSYSIFEQLDAKSKLH